VASVFAVVSKKVYETDARIGGKVLGLGKVWPTAKYGSTHAALKPLEDGGHLFLVTVRPPDEALWLVAVLQDVKATKGGWMSNANTTPITDITALKGRIKFASGAGITAAKGKLGMSLQTPRALAPADVALLLAAPGGAPPPPEGPEIIAARRTPGKVYHLNRHETGKLPCLCAKCLDTSGDRVTVDGETFVRREATAKSRILYYWLPEALVATEKNVRFGVEKQMKLQLRDPTVEGAVPKRKKKRSEDDDDE
jgi:hypothetical protein